MMKKETREMVLGLVVVVAAIIAGALVAYYTMNESMVVRLLLGMATTIGTIMGICIAAAIIGVARNLIDGQ